METQKEISRNIRLLKAAILELPTDKYDYIISVLENECESLTVMLKDKCNWCKHYIKPEAPWDFERCEVGSMVDCQDNGYPNFEPKEK